MLRISSRAEVIDMIGGGWRVLDVGSGDRPFPLATILVDRLPRTQCGAGGVTTENPTARIVRGERPFVVADLEALPFADQSFDFVYASHVIDHVSHPVRALEELRRVAPRGYIECHRAWYEFVDSSPFHGWLVDFTGGELQFRQKLEIEARFMATRRLFDVNPQLFVQFYGQVLSAVDPDGTSIEKSLCQLCVYWEDEIPYRILEPPTYAGV